MGRSHGSGLGRLRAVLYRVLLLAVCGWAVAWAASGIRVDADRIARGLPAIGRILKLMFPLQVGPESAPWLAVAAAGAAGVTALEAARRRRWPVLGTVLLGVVVLYAVADREWLGPAVLATGQSLAIALMGTTVGALLALPLGFWAARNMVVYGVVAALARQLLNAVRTFPEIILAVFFVAAYGPGPLAGVMAVGLHSIGMLAKLYADVIENIDRGPIEALTAAGASPLETVWFAVIPQVLPEFIASALYRFEINMRSATTLGLVGAGGVGVILLQALSFRRWPVVGTALLVIVLTVTAIDSASAWLRRRII
ncbi:MAG: phosphonate ABC transporter, permease protein PhnE [Firmicutes bacterium]|nr:phosphonate ABC transporter, permease protein PhnE [Bacillota bacterium]